MKIGWGSPELKLRAHRVQFLETVGGVILKRGRIEVKIGGERAAEVVHIVLKKTIADDGATRGELLAEFAAPDRPAVEQLIQNLEARSILVPADAKEPVRDGVESNLDVFYWQFGHTTRQVVQRASERTIAILGVNYISRQLATSLIANGMTNVEVVHYPLLCNLHLLDDDGKFPTEQWPVPLKTPILYKDWNGRLEPETLGCVVATSDFGGLQLMRPWNEFCVSNRIHFLPVVLQDLIGYVGPLVVPGETACFECLRARQNSNMQDPDLERRAEAVAFEGQGVAGFHPSMASILGDIATLELNRFYGAWMPQRIVGTLIEVNMLALEMRARKVLKIPRCRVCSNMNIHTSPSLNKDVFFPVQKDPA